MNTRDNPPKRLRKTATERRFEKFISAARRLDCDDTGQRFARVFAEIVPVRRPRETGLQSAGDQARSASGSRDPADAP
jgi:hypothetical protein